VIVKTVYVGVWIKFRVLLNEFVLPCFEPKDGGHLDGETAEVITKYMVCNYV
jgi:hypothetical protein